MSGEPLTTHNVPSGVARMERSVIRERLGSESRPDAPEWLLTWFCR